MNFNELYEQVKSGEINAESSLFKGLTARFGLIAQHKILNQLDAEEIVQDALMTVAAKYKEVEINVSFTAWAQKVLENKILNYYKTKALHKRKIEEISNENPDRPHKTDELLLKDKLLQCFKKINQSNNRYARVLGLHFQGFKVGEICDRLGITQTNLYSILFRARSLLMLCLEKGDIK